MYYLATIDFHSNYFLIVKKTLNSYKVVSSKTGWNNGKFYSLSRITIIGNTSYRNLEECLHNDYPELLI